MAKQFDPRRVLRQISKPLLREFFKRRGELLDLPWDELKESKRVDVIYCAWQQLPEKQRHEVQAVLQDLFEVADERGVRAFAQDVLENDPAQKWKFTACEDHLNKALWFCLQYPERFKEVALFARADTLSHGRYAVRRNSLPTTPLDITSNRIESLQKSLHEYYWPNEMRGRDCRVTHYTRPGGSEYFFAYLDDWPNSYLSFDKYGRLRSESACFAFSIVFAACPQDGSLELIAKGGKAVHYALQKRPFHPALLVASTPRRR